MDKTAAKVVLALLERGFILHQEASKLFISQRVSIPGPEGKPVERVLTKWLDLPLPAHMSARIVAYTVQEYAREIKELLKPQGDVQALPTPKEN